MGLGSQLYMARGWAPATPHMGTKLRSAEEPPRLGTKPEEHSMETSRPVQAVHALGQSMSRAGGCGSLPVQRGWIRLQWGRCSPATVRQLNISVIVQRGCKCWTVNACPRAAVLLVLCAHLLGSLIGQPLPGRLRQQSYCNAELSSHCSSSCSKHAFYG